MLDALNLTPPEEKLYETMIEAPPGTVEELARSLGTTPAAMGSALESLESRGLVSRVPGSPARFAAVAPDVALEVLLLQQEERLKRTRLHVEQLAARFRSASGARNATELVEVVTGRRAVLERAQQIQLCARHEVRAIDKPPYAEPPGEKGFVPSPAELTQLARGIRYRTIYDQAGLDMHDLHTGIIPAIEAGEQARVLSTTPSKIWIADDQIAWMPLQIAPTAIEAIVVVHKSALLEALGALFETLWDRALPFEVFSPEPQPGQGTVMPDRPTDDEQRLLTLMVAGVPDDTIARQLGLSPRTVQRRIRGLMGRLDAGTRIQLAVQATLSGWITRHSSHRPD